MSESKSLPHWWFRTPGDPAPVRWDWDTQGAPYVKGLQGVRQPRSGDRSGHIPVRAYTVTTGSTLRLESGLEHDLVRVLDRDPAVVWLVAQPCQLEFRCEGGARRHTPDLLSITDERVVTVWDARPARRHDERFTEAATVTRAACEQHGWLYEVFTGLDPVYRLNPAVVTRLSPRPALARSPP